MPRGNLFVISGPSGAGKGTLISRLVERNPQTWVSVSATTRSPRPGEIDGKDYHFLSEEEFEQILEELSLIHISSNEPFSFQMV